MRLLFNATNLRSEGGVILMRHLLEGFLAHAPDLHIILYLNPELVPRLPEDMLRQDRLSLVAYRPRGLLKRFRWEQWKLPRIIRKRQIDLLFSFGNTGPRFPGCRQVLYVQQSIPYTDYTPRRHRWRWRGYQALYGFLMGLAQRGSSRVIVPTGWLISPMRRSIGNRKPVADYRVSLPGLPELPERAPDDLLAPHEIELIDQLEQWRASDVQVVFYPAFLAPYKNIPYLLEAVQHLEKHDPPPHRLVLTFDLQSPEYFPCKNSIFPLLDALPAERVMLAGGLSRTAMAEVYRRSDILAFPSLVETLGLPLLEAMSYGLPIIATQATPSSQPHALQAAFAAEICGEAALYADPASPEAFAAQLRLLLEDREQAFQLGENGRRRAASLSWASHIQAILDTP